jgi:hypothetical protein
MKNTAFHLIKDLTSFSQKNLQIENDIRSGTLTTQPLQDNTYRNLSQSDIEKAHINRGEPPHCHCGHLNVGDCFNALKLPFMARTDNGARPAILASFENKIKKDSTGKWQYEKRSKKDSPFTDDLILKSQDILKKLYMKKLAVLFNVLDFYGTVYEQVVIPPISKNIKLDYQLRRATA